MALEPNPYVFEVLAKNAELAKGRCNIIPLKLAAGESDGKMVFEYSDPGYCNGGHHKDISAMKHGHSYKLEVDSVYLPALLERDYAPLLNKLKYIKIDAEGYDYWIALTLEPLLKKYRPYVQLEVFRHLASETREKIFNFFHGLGYVMHAVATAEYPEYGIDSVADMERRRHFDMLCVPSEPS